MIGLVTLVNGVKKLVDISTSPIGVSLPNGYVYIQMPGTEPPVTLFGGTWQLVDYTGNNCGSTFNSGKQGYGLSSTGLCLLVCSAASNHCHRCYFRTCEYRNSGGSITCTVRCGNYLSSQSTGSHSHSAYTGAGWDAETRPDNYTIQIWKKTSD